MAVGYNEEGIAHQAFADGRIARALTIRNPDGSISYGASRKLSPPDPALVAEMDSLVTMMGELGDTARELL